MARRGLLGLFKGFSRAKDPRLLLVTAHPDDETMFFAPLLVAAVQQHARVFVLCLSTGDADGKGEVRAKELLRACAVFGISTRDVTVLDHPHLRDGMHTNWSPVLVAELVAAHLRNVKPDALVTFDAFGVSGHGNHIHTYQGCVLAVSKVRESIELAHLGGYVLQSTSLLRKFLGPLDTLLSLARKDYVAVAVTFNILLVFRAMTQHWSQLLWYRLLFLLLSRFSYVNTFSCMPEGSSYSRG